MGTSQIRHLGIVDEGSEPVSLIAAAAGGDVRAFEQLYARFAPCVYGLCLRLTSQREAAEDCTQDSFVAAWRALHRFEYRSSFSTWLQRIAIHTVLARRRGLRAWNEVAEPSTGLADVAAGRCGDEGDRLGLLIDDSQMPNLAGAHRSSRFPVTAYLDGSNGRMV